MLGQFGAPETYQKARGINISIAPLMIPMKLRIALRSHRLLQRPLRPKPRPAVAQAALLEGRQAQGGSGVRKPLA